MFYSHTLLARKTPLGTVWCAAHLQHRLNKRDYERTKITIVVDAIMFGEVPLALRTSSYLLLGVVRIYSKQLDYLKHDLNALATKINSFSPPPELTLPENAHQAPFHSITLPETFDLDALELDNDVYNDGVPENHLKSQEEITLADQVPVERDAFISITFDEDVTMDISPPGEVPDLGIRSMEEDILPQPPMSSTVNLQSGVSPSEDVANMRLNEDLVPESFPGVEEVPCVVENQELDPSNQSMPNDDDSPEFQRSTFNDFGLQDVSILPPFSGNKTYESSKHGDENINLGNLLPIAEDMETPPMASPEFEQRAGPPASATSNQALEVIGTFSSIKFALRSPTPPQPKARTRKRKQCFDKSTVLTNKFMKKALEDSSDLLRERKTIPSTSLNVWKLNNSLRNEQVLYQPSINGFCPDLCDLFKDDYIATKCRLNSLEEACQDPEDASNTASRNESSLDRVVAPSSVPKAASSPDELEILRSAYVDVNEGGIDIFAPTARSIPSHHKGLGSQSIAAATTELSTPDHLVSTGPSNYMSETTTTRPSPENATLFDIPELFNAADEDELNFLIADNTPGSRRTQGVDSLSVRTRAVGRYLRSLSPVKSISGDSTQDLGLNGILEGKTRKLCARMFYEILVLKSYGLIDVQQDEPYGDINVKLTPKLSNAEI